MASSDVDTFVSSLARTIEHDLVFIGNISPETNIFWDTMGYDPSVIGLQMPMDLHEALSQLRQIGPAHEYVGRIENYFKLPITGNLDRLVENYKEIYYSHDCLDLHTPDFCWSRAIKAGDVEVVERILSQYPSTTMNIYSNIRDVIEYGSAEILKLLLPRIYPYTTQAEELFGLAETLGNSAIVQLLAPKVPSNELHLAIIRSIYKKRYDLTRGLIDGLIQSNRWDTNSFLKTLIRLIPDANTLEFLLSRLPVDIETTTKINESILKEISWVNPLLNYDKLRVLAAHASELQVQHAVENMIREFYYYQKASRKDLIQIFTGQHPKVIQLIVDDRLRDKYKRPTEYEWLDIQNFAMATGAISDSDSDIFVWAAAIGSVPLIEYLLERGVDPHYAEDSALQAAKLYEQQNVVEFLSTL